ncbi:hypothetical protein [Rugosimonospora africana]|uniref:Uncharacterized protein n=1 Tax=Rugosimonospora africana TaxID=556532 RepID=A0A8J3QM29_9ACTN|nr:hypothetical protein [Rugosimonospora africana]GIH13473.1 hypothetical protein Raf01_16450 [Rugosimonospora africana]
MGTRLSWWRIPLSLAILLTAGCTGQERATGGHTGTGPAVPAWRAVTLPATGSGRVEVRDVAACPGHWYAAGGYLLPDGSTRPALWTSSDAERWTAVPVRPTSVYGPAQLLSAVACRGAEVAAVGSTAGGVHANPRISTWISTGGGRLDEVPAAFELYGGPDAIGVGRIAAGPTGWLITGTWRDANGQAGAAVWFTPDGRDFRRVDADPALESDARGQTAVLDAVGGVLGQDSGPAGTGSGFPGAAATGPGFTAVGNVITPGSRTAARDPVVWTSPDGLSWRRETIPAGAEDEALERAARYGDGVLAVGERGHGFGAWLGTSGGWRAAGRFGTFAGTDLPIVTGLAVVTGLAAGSAQRAYALAGDGTRYRLWASTDLASWTELTLPATVPAGDQRLVSLTGTGDRLLLAAEDGQATRLWTAAG